jgi:hypothetical protein
MTAVLYELCWAYVPYENVWCSVRIQMPVANDSQSLCDMSDKQSENEPEMGSLCIIDDLMGSD